MKRIYPLIIAHALIDFFAKFNKLGVDFTVHHTTPTSLTNAIISLILVIPCFFFGMYLMTKYIK